VRQFLPEVKSDRDTGNETAKSSPKEQAPRNAQKRVLPDNAVAAKSKEHAPPKLLKFAPEKGFA
jgi:hypothetical protein